VLPRGPLRGLVAAAFCLVGGWLAHERLTGATDVTAGVVASSTGGPGVLFKGCDQVTVEGRCLLTAGATLTIWLGGAVAPPVSLDGRPRDLHTTPAAGGLRLSLPVAPSDLPATLAIGPQGSSERWTLRLERHEVHPALEAARRLRSDGERAAAAAILLPLTEDPDEGVRAQAHALLGRMARDRGDHAEAVVRLTRSIDQHRAAGSVSGEMHDRFALAYILRNRGDYARVCMTLAEVDARASVYPAAAEDAAYYRAYAAVGVSDYRRALRYGARALEHAERMGDEAVWRAAAELQVETFIDLGRFEEAADLYARLAEETPTQPTCRRALALVILGRLATGLSDTQTLEPARASLRAALELYEERCDNPRHRSNALARLGYVELLAGDLEAASDLLVRSRAAFAEPAIPLRKLQSILQADLSLAQANHEQAEHAYARLELLGRWYGDATTRLRGLVGRGRALEGQGRIEEAIAVYREGERVLDRLSLRAPLGGGREGFVGRHADGSQRLIELLIQKDEIAAAADTARRSRRRVLLGLNARARLDGAPEEARQLWYEALSEHRRIHVDDGPDDRGWDLPVDDIRRRIQRREGRSAATRVQIDDALTALGASLPADRDLEPPPRGVVLLTYHRVEQGWVGFASTAAGSIARHLGPIDVERSTADALAHQLLDPFDAVLDGHARVHVLPNGVLNRVDFHALPWRGRPLVASRPVAYPADVESPTSSDTPRGAEAIVIDPFVKLRTSTKEAAHVERTLSDGGWSVRRLSGAEATRSAVAAATRSPRARLLHYAGHAHYAGLDGWESHLGDPSVELLGVAEILALSSVPDHVVLSGCETAATSAAKDVSGLGLAQAFLMAGARWVIASVRPVRDVDARVVVTALYAAQRRRGVWDGPTLLAEAQSRLSVDRPEVDWASFRVVVR
jgi:tetratricopeptide (TPR) repeat protein